MPSLIATLGANISGFVYDLNSAKGKAQSIGGDIGGSLGGVIKSRLAQAASIGTIEETIRRTIQYADQVDELGTRLGISAEAVQRWDYALSQTGGSIDGVARFFEKLALSRQAAMDGSEKQINAFQRLGVSMDDLKSKRLEDLGVQIGKAFEAGDPQALIASLRDVGGKSAGEMVAAFRTGLQGLLDEASPMWNESAARLGELGDKAEAVWMRIRGGFGDMLSFILGGLDKIARGLDIALSAHVGGVTALFSGKSPMQGAIEAGKAKSAEWEASDKAAAEKRARMGEASQFAGGEGESAKAEKEREKREERIAKLKDQVWEKQAAAYIAELTGQERIDALLRKRALIEPMMAAKYEGNLAKMTEEDILETQLKLADADKEILNARKAFDKEGIKEDKAIAKTGRLEINALQKIGAYVAAPDMGVDVAKRSEQHLQQIEKDINRMASAHRGGNGPEY